MSSAPAPTAQPFNPRLVVGLVAASLAAFAALVLLIAFGGSLGSGRDGRANALSIAAVGFKGLVDLERHFQDVGLIRSPADLETGDQVNVALEPQSQDSLAQLLATRRDKATVIILPKWFTQPDSRHRGWVRALAPGAGEMVERLFETKIDVRLERPPPGAPRAAGEGMLDGLSLPVPEHPQVVSGDNLTPLVRLAGGGGALVAQIGDQPHYIVADPDLLNNHGLRDPATARAALELIDALNSPDSQGVNFDLTMNGLGSRAAPSLLRLAFEPPFLVMTLALIFAALLAGLHGAIRFGQARTERRAIAFGKAALVENSAGLIRLARRETHLGGAYADVIREDAARTTAAPAWLSGDKLNHYLDRLSRRDGAKFTDLARRLAAATDRHELVAAARALFSWKKDIIR
jgi:hypothetical protein